MEDGNVNMSISPVVKQDGQKKVYVLFKTDNDIAPKEAEILMPDAKVVRNVGFSEDEQHQLMAYCVSQKKLIFERASKISVMDAFLGQ
ncbi:hypothetical protein SAMN04487761_11054 [Lachnospiraceae bacterium C7]|nr:hypothetical protein SAMN04487761_11054 [Lachnospiraceae bacterium C7]